MPDAVPATQLFNERIRELRAYVDTVRRRNLVRVVRTAEVPAWPPGKKGNVVLQADTAVELGSPQDESVAFHVWTADPDLVHDGCITLVGPDVGESLGRHLPFGKAVLLGVEDICEENCVERYRELGLRRYDLNLAGYMLRAPSQVGREWSRVSRQAVDGGFTLATLGGALIRLYKALPYVKSAEVLVVTSSPADVRELSMIGERASRQMDAWNKMTTELVRECESCEFNDVCSQVEDFRVSRRTPQQGERRV
jgi:CO dehydrogenase/acetyl-CoA synthase beta subunit